MENLSRSIAQGFDRLDATSRQIVVAQAAGTAATVAGFAVTTEVSRRGFGTLSQDMQVVDGTLEQMSQATVQLDSLRRGSRCREARRR